MCSRNMSCNVTDQWMCVTSPNKETDLVCLVYAMNYGNKVTDNIDTLASRVLLFLYIKPTLKTMAHNFHKFGENFFSTNDHDRGHLCTCFFKFWKTATKIYKDLFFLDWANRMHAEGGTSWITSWNTSLCQERACACLKGICLLFREKKTTLKSLFCAKLLTRPNKSKQEMISLRQNVFSGVIFKLKCALRVQQAYQLFKWFAFYVGEIYFFLVVHAAI